MRQPLETRQRRRYSAAAVLFAATLIVGPIEGQVVSTLAGSGAPGGADGTGTDATFNFPADVSVDSLGNVYVADYGNSKIRKITPEGLVTTIAGSGVYGRADGPGTVASFSSPLGVAVDSSGNIFVADTDNNTIRKISPAYVVTTFAGSGAQGSRDGMGTAALFTLPMDVALDSSGNVYVADPGNNKIRKISPEGSVTTFAGSGALGSVDGYGPAASFYRPGALTVDSIGNVYVTEQSTNKVRKITPAGLVTTLAGSGAEGSADGAGTAATFHSPTSVAADSSGNIFVTDAGNNKIRRITPEGMVTTFAGSGAEGGADGSAAAATFHSPSGVAVDAAGNIYVADWGNQKIRKITLSTGSCTPDAQTACLIGGRYKVTSRWKNQYAGGQVSTLSTTKQTDATAAFWLTDANTYEYMIRISTATDNGRAWISILTFTDVEFWVAVTDTVSGQYYEYHSPAGNRTLLYDPYFFVYP